MKESGKAKILTNELSPLWFLPLYLNKQCHFNVASSVGLRILIVIVERSVACKYCYHVAGLACLADT